MGNEKMNEPFLLQGDSGKKSKEQLMKDLFLTLEKHPKAYEAADIVHLRLPHPIQVTSRYLISFSVPLLFTDFLSDIDKFSATAL